MRLKITHHTVYRYDAPVSFVVQSLRTTPSAFDGQKVIDWTVSIDGAEAGPGFRDFTRIAASDPTMWRDVFLSNKDAVLEMLQRFSEDLTALQRAIRWGDGDALFDLFSRTRTVRRSIIEQGQDDDRPDFGRADH